MKAVGLIYTERTADDKAMVEMSVLTEGYYVPVRFILENEAEIPDDAPDYGLFEFEPADQFCKWIDPNKA